MIPTHYTVSEGGYWLKWPANMTVLDGFRDLPHVHSMKLEDGNTWDEINGLRPREVSGLLSARRDIWGPNA